MRTDVGADITLHALVGVPSRDFDSDAAFLKGSRTLGQGTVRAGHELGDGDGVAAHGVGRDHHIGDVLSQLLAIGLDLRCCRLVLGVGPSAGDLNLLHAFHASIHGIVVTHDDIHTLMAIALHDSVLHVLDSLFHGDDLGQLEEGSLEDRVGSVAHAQLDGLVGGVAGIHLDVVLSQVTLGRGGQMFLQLLEVPRTVEQEGTTGFDVLDDVELFNIGSQMTGHEVGLCDIVRGFDLIFAKTQVADGDTAGLLRVILEVSLDLHIGVVADDLDGIFVGTHGTVTAQAPELTGDGVLVSHIRLLQDGQGAMGHVIGDVDGKAADRVFTLAVAEGSQDTAGSGILRAQAISAAHDLCPGKGTSGQRCHNVQVERFADGGRLLTAVHDYHVLGGGGQSRHKAFRGKRTIETDFHQTDFLTLSVHVVYHFLSGVAHRTHGDHDRLSVRRTVVIEELIVGPQLLVDLPHVLLHHVRKRIIILVPGLVDLEEDVGILGRTAQDRMLRVQSTGAERGQGVHVHHVLQVLIVPHLHFLDLVGGAEAIEEVQEGHPATDGRQMGHSTQIHDLLGVVAAQHGVAGGAAGHHIAVVSEDGQCMGRQRTGRNMGHAGQQAAGDLIHVGDHQQ